MQSTSREASLPAAHNDDSFCWQQLPANALSFYLSHYLYLSLAHGLHFSPYHITVFAPLIRTASFGSWLEWTSRFHSNGLLWVYRCVCECIRVCVSGNKLLTVTKINGKLRKITRVLQEIVMWKSKQRNHLCLLVELFKQNPSTRNVWTTTQKGEICLFGKYPRELFLAGISSELQVQINSQKF